MPRSLNMLSFWTGGTTETNPTRRDSVVPIHQSQAASLSQVDLVYRLRLELQKAKEEINLLRGPERRNDERSTVGEWKPMPEPVNPIPINISPIRYTTAWALHELTAPRSKNDEEKLKLLQKNLEKVERDSASLIAANEELTRRLKAAENHPAPANPSIVWYDDQTSSSIRKLTKRLEAVWDSIADAVQDLTYAIARKEPEFIVARKEPDFIVARDAKLSYDKVVKLVGEPLAELIAHDDQRNDTAVNHPFAQIVLQIFLTNLCASKIELLAPNNPPVSDMYPFLYRNILDKEGLDVAGNWRALIHANAELDMTGWEDDAMDSLMTILRFANWAVEAQVLQLFVGELTAIFKKIKKIRVILREKITSVQIEIYHVPFSTDFLPGSMLDDLAKRIETSKSSGAIQCVAGTTAFGLKQLVEGERTQSGHLIYRQIVTPKVVLESGVRSVLQKYRKHKSTTRVAVDSMMCGKD